MKEQIQLTLEELSSMVSDPTHLFDEEGMYILLPLLAMILGSLTLETPTEKMALVNQLTI